MEPQARTADAAVTFRLKTDGGVTRAIDVRLREGTRVSRAQGRFGDLSGSKHPYSRGRAPRVRQHSASEVDADEPAPRVARRWVDSLVAGDRAAVLQLYAPDCLIHTRSGAETGRNAAQESIDRNPLLGSGHHDVRIRSEGSRIQVRWPLSADDLTRVPVAEQRTRTALRIVHGQIAEQWE